jgi:hypothetical protein
MVDAGDCDALPTVAFEQDLFAPGPDKKEHREARPGLVEVLGLLGVAARMSQYIWSEKANSRQPIFDLEGPMLRSPRPGPFAGVPLGGRSTFQRT